MSPLRSLATPAVPVSWGELLDKITILEIKRERIAAPEARANVERELRLLETIARPAIAVAGSAPLVAQLKRVNEELWDIEDAIRRRDAACSFGAQFVALAKSVYRRNDERAELKRALNRLLGSELVEEKSYAAFQASEPTPAPQLAMSSPA